MRNQSVNEYGAIVLGPMSKTQNHDGQDWRDYHAIPYHRPNQGRIKMNNLNEIEEKIEIANALIEQTTKSVELINRLLAVIDQYKNTVDMALEQRNEMIALLATCTDERDRARATAVRLEQECHSCTNKDHHA
tara:strand:+ start:310 stop:708 length:399 start_codon:yes stop_codon:yes gene_type:complete